MIKTICSLSFLLCGCAIGPLTSNETARTVGKSKSELSGSYGSAGHAFKWNYGLRDNIDLGVHWETFSLGLRAKYAFMNRQDAGSSFSAAIGYGDSVGGNHYYADLLASYLVGRFEPYGVFRYVSVNQQAYQSDGGSTNDTISEPSVFFNFDNGERQFTYSQFMFGSRFWIKPQFYGILEATMLLLPPDLSDMSTIWLLNMGAGVRF